MTWREVEKDACAGNDARVRMPPSRNELAWIEFIRLISNDRDPRPTLASVQQLRLLLRGEGCPRVAPSLFPG